MGAGARCRWAVAARLADEYRAARYNRAYPTVKDIAGSELDGSRPGRARAGAEPGSTGAGPLRRGGWQRSGRVRRRCLGRDATLRARGPAFVLSLPPTARVFVAVEPFDLRGSFDAIAGAVPGSASTPSDGYFYLFLNKRR